MSINKGRNRNTAWFAAIDKEWTALKGCFETYLSDGNFSSDGKPNLPLSELTKEFLYKFDSNELNA